MATKTAKKTTKRDEMLKLPCHASLKRSLANAAAKCDPPTTMTNLARHVLERYVASLDQSK